MKDKSTASTLHLLSQVLEQEFGQAPLQHYGIFSDSSGIDGVGSTELRAAQQRFAERLRELVIQAGTQSRLLVVGDTLMPLAVSLAEAGFGVHWIGSSQLLTPELHGQEGFTYAGDDFVAAIEPESVDVLLLEGSLCYLDQLALLSKSRDLIGEAGQLILFSEYIRDDSRIEYSALPNLSSFKQLSRRLGFKQLESQDFTTSALQTLQLLQPLIEKHGKTLADEGAIDGDSQTHLRGEVDHMVEEFASGRRGFYLFVLTREGAALSEWSDVEFGDIGSFQPQEVAELFEQSFNVSFDEGLWNWKYARAGGKCVVARLDKNGPVVAHYGGAPRKIFYFGDSALAIQPCDVMVHPSMRKQYGKGSLFFEVAATFLEREIGNTVGHLLGFGFPNQKTMNISTRLGLYEKTDDFIEIVYPSTGSSSQERPLSIADYNAQDAAEQEALDRLWLEMRADYVEGIIGVRDSEYINYRYISHPFSEGGQYSCLMIRDEDSGEYVAFAALKEHAEGKLLMDIVCPVKTMEVALSALIQYLGSKEPAEVLRVWITKSGSERLLTDGAIVNELGIEIPCNSWNPGPGAELLYGAWWLTAGDMDFV